MSDITIHKIDSPLGILTAGASNDGICMLEFDNQKRIETHQKEFEKNHSISKNKSNEHIQSLTTQLNQYFNKDLKSFDLALDIIGTPFQTKVWAALQTIPFGATRSYKEQAIAVGDLKAIRAVATANGANRISIIIPCHRVIGSNGSLTGFGGGLWRKKFLLDLESEQMNLF